MHGLQTHSKCAYVSESIPILYRISEIIISPQRGEMFIARMPHYKLPRADSARGRWYIKLKRMCLYRIPFRIQTSLSRATDRSGMRPAGTL